MSKLKSSYDQFHEAHVRGESDKIPWDSTCQYLAKTKYLPAMVDKFMNFIHGHEHETVMLMTPDGSDMIKVPALAISTEIRRLTERLNETVEEMQLMHEQLTHQKSMITNLETQVELLSSRRKISIDRCVGSSATSETGDDHRSVDSDYHSTTEGQLTPQQQNSIP